MSPAGTWAGEIRVRLKISATETKSAPSSIETGISRPCRAPTWCVGLPTYVVTASLASISMFRMNNLSRSASRDIVIPGVPVTQQEAIEYLLRRLGKLSDGDTELPRVVLQRGPTGIGKSWTIQQFHNQLCASADNQYWPKIDADVAAARPLASRKLVGPDPREFVWGAVAVPTFGWWGFNCERLERGVVQSVLDEASLQIDVHWLPLKQRWNQVAGIGQKAKKAWKEISQGMR